MKKGLKRLSGIFMLGTALLSQDASAADKIAGFDINEVVPCTGDSVRELLHMPQSHRRDALELLLGSVFKKQNLIAVISTSQQKIYTVLKESGAPCVFDEGINETTLKENSFHEQRILGVKEAVLGITGTMLNQSDLFLRKIHFDIKKVSLMYLTEMYVIEKSRNPVDAESVDYYLNDLIVPLASDSREIFEAMDKTKPVGEQLGQLIDLLEQERQEINTEIDIIQNGEESLLKKHPYLGGGALKLADEGKIKVLAGEDEALNIKGNKLLKLIKQKVLELESKLSNLGVVPQIIDILLSEKGYEDEAKKLGVLSEYQAYLKAKSDFEENIERRDDYVVNAVGSYKGQEFTLPVVFGAAHDFENNVIEYNHNNPDEPMCLSRVDFGTEE